MITPPRPDRVARGRHHWWIWFYERPRPGIPRPIVLVTVKRDR